MTTVQEDRREAAIEAYGVLGRPARRDLVELAGLAALVCDVPTAAINLMTATEQHQVATVGFEAATCRREDAMCATTITLDGPVLVADASRDERFRDHPRVTGEIGSVRFHASHPLRTPDGTVIGTLCAFDVEPRALTPERDHALANLAARVVDVLELELATRRLTAADQRLAGFAGQVSHDLKNPLTAVAMSLEMAVDEAAELEGADTLVSLLDRASRGTDRMQRMIDDLLAFARGGMTPELGQVDLGALVRDLLEELAPMPGSVTVEVGELPTVFADPGQLHSLVKNLLANSLQFTHEGVATHIRVTAEHLDAHWRIEVTDNGRGIPQDQHDRVFEPFAKVDRTEPGTGVGLATARRIVEAHGGRIGIASPADGGTTVWFLLPSETRSDGATGSVPV